MAARAMGLWSVHGRARSARHPEVCSASALEHVVPCTHAPGGQPGIAHTGCPPVSASAITGIARSVSTVRPGSAESQGGRSEGGAPLALTTALCSRWKALYENMLVELPFAGFFLSKLLGTSADVDIHHLASLDPEVYKNLLFLKSYEGDVEELGLNFTVVNNDLGEAQVRAGPDAAAVPVGRQGPSVWKGSSAFQCPEGSTWGVGVWRCTGHSPSPP